MEPRSEGRSRKGAKAPTKSGKSIGIPRRTIDPRAGHYSDELNGFLGDKREPGETDDDGFWASA